MNLLSQFDQLFPLVCEWVADQEVIILEKGTALSPDQKIDAHQIGIKEIDRVRLMKIDQIPSPNDPILKAAVEYTGLLSPHTVGITFQYGIYIRSDLWNDRRLVVHELTHTLQYERMGGIPPFLDQYLKECLTVGYPNSPLELEAIGMEKEICG